MNKVNQPFSRSRERFETVPYKSKAIRQIQKLLLGWFEKHKRPLPWRVAHVDPYRIFVVEVMLQQTQIKTVLPYYDRWFKTFPTVDALARAPIDRVLKLWEGLGYYSRARNLHKAAQMIVSEFKSLVPDNVEDLLKLPGIGRYTAGAISSIAHGKPVPLVDGNVSRVLTRLLRLSDDITKPQTQKKLYEIAGLLVPKSNPGSFNQALMELGSLICSPEQPVCGECPLSRLCKAFQSGEVLRFPVKSKGVKVKKMSMAVGILKHGSQILVRRRAARGIWGGLWELPSIVQKNQLKQEHLLKLEFEKMGFKTRVLKAAPLIRHRFTHRDASLYPFELILKSKANSCHPEANVPKIRRRISRSLDSSPDGLRMTIKNNEIRWADLKMLETLSFPVPHRTILNRLNLTHSTSS